MVSGTGPPEARIKARELAEMSGLLFRASGSDISTNSVLSCMHGDNGGLDGRQPAGHTGGTTQAARVGTTRF